MGSYYSVDSKYGDDKKENPVFGIRTIGASRWLDQSGTDPLKVVQAEIWAGAGHIEITAPGTGRGGKGNSTFEEIDNEQRQAIRETMRVNKVDLSVHASPNVNLAGLGREGYSDQARESAIEEVKKAIDFSRDASSGGSVVIHTGEFPRALDVPGRYKDEFRMYAREKEEARYLLIDKETGSMVQSVKANEIIFVPEYKKDKDGKDVYMLDEDGKPVYDDVMKEHLMQSHKVDAWDKVPEKAKMEARIKLAAMDEHDNIKTKRMTFQEFVDAEAKEGKEMKEILKDFYKQQAFARVNQSLGQSRLYEQEYRTGLEQREELIKKLNFYKKLKDKVGEGSDEWDKIKSDYTVGAARGRLDVGQELLDPITSITEQMNDTQRRILHGQEVSLGGRKEAKQLLRQIDNAEVIDDYALDKSKKSFAELGIYAMEQTQAAQKMRPGDNVKPIFITLENIYPEMGYGSHPEELMQLVKNAREEMSKELVEKMNMDKKAAAKAAEDHIKITFDTGHMNMWRKHYIPEKGEKKEETDERFKKWYLDQVEKMAKSGMIGNVHLADNFGYDDAHLAPGHGSTPIKEVLDILKKNGYDEKMAVEGGFNQGKTGYHEAWKLTGAHVSNVYGRGKEGTDAWLNPSSSFKYIRDGYLGVANRPNFIFRGYSPEGDDWKPWSGQGME